MDGRRLTDFQRIVIYFSAVAAVFLAAMGLGWQNLWLLLAAVIVLLVAVLSVIVVAVRRGPGAHEIVTAQVLSVSAPPPNTGIAARCDMQVEVRLPGRPPIRARLRDPAVPLERWPKPGQTFPVDVFGGNPRRHMRIRWDLVGQGLVRAPEGGGPASAADTGQAPMWEEENEPIIFSPTPPRPRRPAAAAPPTPPPAAPAAASAPVPDATPVAETAVYLHEKFTDIDDETVRTPSSSPSTPPQPTPTPPPSTPTRRSPAADGNGHDPYGYDPADFEAPRLTPPSAAPAATGGPGFEAVPLTEFDPAKVDIRDFTGEPPAVTPMPVDDDEPTSLSPGEQPPRGAGDEQPPAAGEGPRTIPLPRDPDGVSENRDE